MSDKRGTNRHERKADDEQLSRTFTGAEWDLELIHAAWRSVEKVAKEMGPGASSSLGAIGGGGSEDTPVERQAFSLAFDPSEGARLHHAKMKQLLYDLACEANRVPRLVPSVCWSRGCSQFGKDEGCALHKVGLKSRGRENQVELCARCRSPEPDVHRIDGQPYCKKGRELPTGEWQPACYDAERRDRRVAG